MVGGRLAAALLACVLVVPWLRPGASPGGWLAWVLVAEAAWIPVVLLAGESAGKRRTWAIGSGWDRRRVLLASMVVPGAWGARGETASIWLVAAVLPGLAWLWESLRERDAVRGGLAMQRQAIRAGLSLLVAVAASGMAPASLLPVGPGGPGVDGVGLWEREPDRMRLAGALHFGLRAVLP